MFKKLSTEEIKKENESNVQDLHNKLVIVSYLEPIELFFTGNSYFKEQAFLDLQDLKEARKENTVVKSAWRTRDLMLENIQEAEISEIHSLFDLKFAEAQRDNGFKTKSAFAKHEIKYMRGLYANYFGWFPILEQWIDYLEVIATKNTWGVEDNSNGYPETKAPIEIDNRINSSASKEEIINHFKVLLNSNNKKQQIIEADDLDCLLQANFIVFNLKAKKILTPLCSKWDIGYLVHSFYNTHISNGGATADKYTTFLIENFTQFQNDSHATIIKQWSKRPKKYALG
ncbi:MAG: hypothetical protein K0R51_3458 [Cytophagaceae bacterium]|jgi:hypothetical protein|nr:hypothetical protein [Cytophagaceae bacterium]